MSISTRSAESITPMHAALLYRDSAQYVHGVVSFVRASVDAGHPTLIAAPPVRLALLRAALNDLHRGAEMITWVDMMELGRNPARIIPAARQFVDSNVDRGVSIVGDPLWPERSPEELLACVEHEALVNLAYDGCGANILCPYDTGMLSQGFLLDVERTHPLLNDGEGSHESRHYGTPERVAVEAAGALSAPQASAQTLIFSAAGAVRALVDDFADRSPLSHQRAADLVLAVNELASNTVRHAGGVGVMRIWTTDRAVVCEVRDSGYITDVLVGRVAPEPTAEGGRGLLLVNALCDLVQIRSTPSGTTVRVTVNVS